MTLNIISAEKVEFTGEVTKVTLPGVNGLFTVLENHAALISSLTSGKMVYTVNNRDEVLEIKGGIADINHNVVSVCLY